jgi:glutathione S-transferase
MLDKNMAWVYLVTALALVQFTFFGALVSKGRKQHSVLPPTMTGPAAFEALVRVHLNTLERLIVFVPLLWMAAMFWPAQWAALVGAFFIVGRFMYWRAYVKRPDLRQPGNILSMLAIAVLLLATLTGLVQTALK